MNQDERFMSMVLGLARRGIGRTSPNPAVGCVIARKGKILSTGFHRGPGLPHAEIEALRRCSGRAKGATLYVNLEPCCHFGRTPPCTDAIIKSGIKRVVIGMKDPDPHVRGRGIRILREAGLEIRTGVLEGDCRKINEAYSIHRTEGRPFVILKMAVALNGMVGWRGRGPIRSALQVTGWEAQAYAHTVRDQVDAILVGSKTVLADDPRLTTRLAKGRGRDPIRVILDSRLKIPPSARLFHSHSRAKTLIFTSSRANRYRRGALERLGVIVKECRGRNRSEIPLEVVLRDLANMGVMTLLVEGGPQVWCSFLRQKKVDSLLLLVGAGRRHWVSLRHAVMAPLTELQGFHLSSARGLGRDLLLQLDPP